MKKNLKAKFSNRQYMLSKDFEIYYYSDRELPNVKRHSHNYYEFYFFLEGNIVMHIDDKSFSPTPGTMIIIPPKTPHYIRFTQEHTAYRRFVFWISQDFLNTLNKHSTDYSYLTDKSYPHGLIQNFSEIEFNTLQGKMFSLIDEINSARFGKEAKLFLLVSDFILSISRFVYDKDHPYSATADSISLYQTLIQYIETHIDEDLSLEYLASQFHVSKFHISHLFKDANGIPLHRYVTKKRLSMCLDAILSGMHISDAYLAYGFSDYSVFYRAFVKEYGKSPKKYCMSIFNSTPF
ncbi:MAG TPA: AraC family transcriptional regulator [Lachnospiraceae bacterium]